MIPGPLSSHTSTLCTILDGADLFTFKVVLSGPTLALCRVFRLDTGEMVILTVGHPWRFSSDLKTPAEMVITAANALRSSLQYCRAKPEGSICLLYKWTDTVFWHCRAEYTCHWASNGRMSGQSLLSYPGISPASCSGITEQQVITSTAETWSRRSSLYQYWASIGYDRQSFIQQWAIV